jgi:vacuolar-type H+-ATPase subunit F/Vma7
MHVRLIGDVHDATGFSLAGVESEECHTRAEAVSALDAARHDPGVAIIVVSPGIAALAADVIDQMLEAARLPITIVLPERPAGGHVAAGVQP